MEETFSTKQIVLRELKRGGIASGEDLAAMAGVSRAAIWKAVNRLRREGYAIDASTKKGYILHSEKNAVQRVAIDEYLHFLLPDENIDLHFFESVDSTNNVLKRLAASGGKVHKTAAVALEQTAGRGRLGRSFFSSAQTGVFLSLLFAPKAGVSDPAQLTANAAVAVCRVFSRLYRVEAQIKWVNDIFVGGKKVCGILTEGVSNLETGKIDAAIVGIGINISAGEDLPEEVAAVAGFLQDAVSSAIVDKNLVIASVLAELVKIYEKIEGGDEGEREKCLEEYRARSLLAGMTVEVSPVIADEEKKYVARVIGIGDDLSLIVEKEGGERVALKSGEVSLKSAVVAEEIADL